ncbi:PrsW family intramembrane metalloprotease [Candidatus Peregrinibacteria bacterium]|nr:PrsW family intramembrane metalloprotease [Candidatus Peregrinibacteria bacterium]
MAGVLAIIPAIFWGVVFYQKQPESKRTTIILFLAGTVSVAPLLLYKYLWQFFPWINAFVYTNTFNDNLVGFANLSLVPLDVLATFMIVGAIEEIAKFSAVRMIHRKRICSITDCIEYFIIVALGFAFAENIIYFYNIMSVRGVDGIFLPFVFRSLFSTFAHVMFSGIFGYYYGLATFPNQVMSESYNQGKWQFIRSLIKFFRLDRLKAFHDEKIIQGLLIAVVLHAFFNIFLEMNWTFLIVPYLTIGFIVLSYMFDNRRVDKDYCTIEK